MSQLLSEIEAVLERMDPAKREEVRKAVRHKLTQLWLPNPGPQTQAYLSEADWLLYGGAAGGGKSDLLLGTALTNHWKALIFRRAYVDLREMEERLIEMIKSRDGYNGADKIYRNHGRSLEFGALEKPGAEFTWQGRPHDLIGFDEGAQLSFDKVMFVTGWLRSVRLGQRKRIIIATNPPMGGEGVWLVEFFAPWLDPLFPNPARPGELRWAIIVGQDTVWRDGPGDTVIGDKKYTHESRTFIPALLDDNPYLADTGYRARIENMREPLRSQLLTGDFNAGRQDHEWQVIPSAWVLAANDRWRAAPVQHRTMVALAGDIAMGGIDKTVLSALHADNWFAPAVVIDGSGKDEVWIVPTIAGQMVAIRRDEADMAVDATGGYGSGVRTLLKREHGLECYGIVFSAGSQNRAKDGKHTFKNLRAEMYWRFYEALDPTSGEDIKLPPDPRLLAELTAARYTVRGTDIVIESKEDIKKRLGGTSVDRADAVVIAWHRRHSAVKRGLRGGVVSGLPPPPPPRSLPPAIGRDAWMINR